MRMIIRAVACAVLLSTVAAAGQTRPPQFDVASVRPSSEQAQVTVGLRISGSQVRYTAMSLTDYIGIAYGVRPTQIAAPDWLARARFDIAGKIPDGESTDHVAEMLQALLADRFQLKMHRESKEFSVFALVVAKGGSKLQESPANAAEGPANVNITGTGGAGGVAVDLGGGAFFTLANNRVDVRKTPMAQLVNMLARFFDRPVVDMTGLKGAYDLSLDLTPEDYNAMMIRAALNAGVVLPPPALRALDAGSADPLSNGLQKFGLAFESRKAPLDVIVVDSMLKMPTEN